MPDWAIWLIAAAALAGIEVLSVTFVFGPLALAALLAAAVAAVSDGWALPIGAFAVASAASLLVLRPIARSHLRVPASVRTGTAALVGATAVVVERVDASGGRVKLAGEIWSARAYDDSQAFEPGQRVSVLEIQGATALVSD
jgi:membrane protein implicated in regulation of membrane protease activity